MKMKITESLRFTSPLTCLGSNPLVRCDGGPTERQRVLTTSSTHNSFHNTPKSSKFSRASHSSNTVSDLSYRRFAPLIDVSLFQGLNSFCSTHLLLPRPTDDEGDWFSAKNEPLDKHSPRFPFVFKAVPLPAG
jgi:hypothetical protein